MSEEKKAKSENKLILRIAVTAIFIAVGVVLSYINPFGYFEISGTKINPFAHFINALSGVLLGLTFSVIAALGIAVIRFSFNIGTIHAFHGGISGAVIVSIVSHFLHKKYPKYVDYAAFFEPLGTVFIGGTITTLIEGFTIGNLLFIWGMFMAASVVGSALGFIVLKVIKDTGYSRETFLN
jgi:energy coupling factor transporter S component ThiW